MHGDGRKKKSTCAAALSRENSLENFAKRTREDYQGFFSSLLNVHGSVHGLQVISRVTVSYLDYLLQIIFLVIFSNGFNEV